MTPPRSSDSSGALASYVPPYVLRRLSQDGLPEVPAVEPMSGALLLADIAGFTRLSEQLAEKGLDGAETLTQALNGYFGWTIDQITEYGGEVVGFAGDALMAMWPSTAESGSLRDAVLRAAACALTLAVPDASAIVLKDAPLTVRFGLSSGDFFGVELGGHRGRRHCLLTGAPVEVVAEVNDLAEAGEIVVDGDTWHLVADACEGTATSGGAFLLTAAPSLDEHEPPAAPDPIDPEVVDELSAYVPLAVFGREETGQTAWLAELRLVTVMFVNLPDVDFHESADSAQQLAATLQIQLDRHEATINKLSIDSHGTSLLVATGLPPLSHDDDALRGVRSALAVADALNQMGRRGAVGVATGRVFCGPIGNEFRREYTLIGDVVNTAARLMQSALEGAGVGVQVLCDASTYRTTQDRIDYGSPRELLVKGKTRPVVAYEPVGRRRTRRAMKGSLVGRDLEREVLLSNLDAACSGECRVVIIEGEPGIGKTHLVNEAVALVAERDLRCLTGTADPIERTVPYHAWRNVFATLLGVDENLPSAARAEQVVQALEPERQHLSPLLNVVLGLNMSETEATAQLAGERRIEATHEFMIDLLVAQSQETLILSLDDCHWLDSASWALILELSRRPLPILLILASRPVGDDALPAQALRIFNQANTKVMRLGSLEDSDAVTLACARLGVTSVPEQVATLIVQRSGGNPLFAEELVYAMADAGVIRVADGECSLAAAEAALVTVTMHDTVEGVIGSRIDSLEARPELALKVASVVGPNFSAEAVRDVYPVAEDRRYLPGCLETLERRNLTVLEQSSPVEYVFRHALTRDVAYNRMLFAQRRELHRAVAEWVDRNHADHLEPYYSTLAYHWTRAEVVDKACQYLELAALYAVNNGMGREAVNLGLEAAALLGVELPRELPAIGEQIEQTLSKIEERLAGQPVEDLAELPPLSDPAIAGAIQVLIQTAPPAHMTQQPELFALMGLRAFLLTIEHGATPFTPAVISIYGLLVGALLQDTQRAFTLTDLARKLADRDCPPVRAYSGFVHSYFTNHWVEPIRPALPEFLTDSQMGFEHGDVMFACFNAAGYVVMLSRIGVPLDDVIMEAQKASEVIDGRVAAAGFHALHEMQFAKALAGRTVDRYSFADPPGEGGVLEHDLASICDTDLATQIGSYLCSKMRLRYYYRDFAEAVRFGEETELLRPAFAQQPEEVDFVFFYALSLAAAGTEANDLELLERASACLAQMKAWESVGPRNFAHKVLTVEGELARSAGDVDRAVSLLRDAADEARAIDFIHHAALALELAGRCLMNAEEQAETETARALLSEAASLYAQWGATVKHQDVMETLAELA